LSCHLAIEHYLDNFLKSISPDLDWKKGNLSFAQKVNLLGELDIYKSNDFIPTLKHMNSLRNKFSHQLDFQPSGEDFLPFTYFLKKLKGIDQEEESEIPTSKIEVLELFTNSICAWLGGAVWSFEWHRNQKDTIEDS
ncbi:MAG: hypothetical protein AAF202_02920, partial [Pseudomonadota bacterium]